MPRAYGQYCIIFVKQHALTIDENASRVHSQSTRQRLHFLSTRTATSEKNGTPWRAQETRSRGDLTHLRAMSWRTSDVIPKIYPHIQRLRRTKTTTRTSRAMPKKLISVIENTKCQCWSAPKTQKRFFCKPRENKRKVNNGEVDTKILRFSATHWIYREKRNDETRRRTMAWVKIYERHGKLPQHKPDDFLTRYWKRTGKSTTPLFERTNVCIDKWRCATEVGAHQQPRKNGDRSGYIRRYDLHQSNRRSV